MNKKDALYQIIKTKDVITVKQINELGYARIYISMLEKENKIFKLARGVYSIKKEIRIDPLVEFQRNNKKIIYSGFTALNLLNYYKSATPIQISVPQGYNASRYNNKEVFYNNIDNYGKGTTQVNLNSTSITVYDIERSICDIIKDQNRYDHREYLKLINHYFTSDNINYQKLLEYSKLLKISNKVQTYLSLFKI